MVDDGYDPDDHGDDRDHEPSEPSEDGGEERDAEPLGEDGVPCGDSRPAVAVDQSPHEDFEDSQVVQDEIPFTQADDSQSPGAFEGAPVEDQPAEEVVTPVAAPPPAMPDATSPELVHAVKMRAIVSARAQALRQSGSAGMMFVFIFLHEAALLARFQMRSFKLLVLEHAPDPGNALPLAKKPQPVRNRLPWEMGLVPATCTWVSRTFCFPSPMASCIVTR